MRKALRSFESTRRNIENDICHNEITIFDECDKDSDDIKSAYRSFWNAKFWNEKEM